MTPENGSKSLPQSSTKSTGSTKQNPKENFYFSNFVSFRSIQEFSHDLHHGKGHSMSDEEGKRKEIPMKSVFLHVVFFPWIKGHLSRNDYAEINNLDAIGNTAKLTGFNRPKPVSSKRPPSSATRRNVRIFTWRNHNHFMCCLSFLAGKWFKQNDRYCRRSQPGSRNRRKSKFRKKNKSPDLFVQVENDRFNV